MSTPMTRERVTQGHNGYCTVIGNAYFTYFRTTERKSRQSFLETLQGESPCYVLNEYAQQYLQSCPLAAKYWQVLSFSSQVLAQDSAQWQTVLTALGIVRPQAVRRVTEAALLGGVIEQGVDERLVILSDGAPQFNVLVHALCWVHAERALRRLQGNTSQQRQNIEEMQQQLWPYYQQLKTYAQAPTAERKQHLEQAFDQLFWSLLPAPCLAQYRVTAIQSPHRGAVWRGVVGPPRAPSNPRVAAD